MPSTLESLVPLTTGSALSGSIGALVFTALPGFQMYLMWSKLWPTQIPAARQALIEYVDKGTTTNPVVLPDGRNFNEPPSSNTNSHICLAFCVRGGLFAIPDQDVIATRQRHTLLRCLLPAYSEWPTNLPIWLSKASTARNNPCYCRYPAHCKK